MRDTYLFKSFSASEAGKPPAPIKIDTQAEIYKQNGVNEFKRKDLKNEEKDQFLEPGTVRQIQVFHQWLISDIYKRHKDVNYEMCFEDKNIEMTKKYYIVPIKIVKDQPSPMKRQKVSEHSKNRDQDLN